MIIKLTLKCNLICEGCDLIREYHESAIEKKEIGSVEKCLEIVEKANSLVYSITRGEPLIHRCAEGSKIYLP